MSNPNICPKCQSGKRVRGVRFLDRDQTYDRDASLELARYPEAIFFKGKQQFPLEADVCGECGFVEFYVKSPRDLWNAVEENAVEEQGQ